MATTPEPAAAKPRRRDARRRAVDVSALGHRAEGARPAGRTARHAPEIPGFAAGAVTMGGPRAAAIVFGKADETAANSTLLAEDLRAAAGELPEKQIVELGDGVQAAHYDDLPIGGGKTATVFAVPTTEGVATLACTADAETCETIASSLRITDGKTFPVGPSKEYAGDVESVLGKLEKQREVGRRRAQARRQAHEPGRRHEPPRHRLRRRRDARSARSSVSPADALLNAQLVDALRDAGSAYKKAAAEGRSKDRAGYKRQGARAVAAGKDLETALGGLTSAGYDAARRRSSRAPPRSPSSRR